MYSTNVSGWISAPSVTPSWVSTPSYTWRNWKPKTPQFKSMGCAATLPKHTTSALSEEGFPSKICTIKK